MRSNGDFWQALPLYLSIAVALLLAVTEFSVNASAGTLLTLVPILLWAIVFWRGRTR